MLRLRKKGVSIMIGYVLLIVGAIVVGGIVYGWLRTYVPQEAIECPDGISIFIKDWDCDTNNKFDLSLTNNGRFSVNGFYIRVAEDTEQVIATEDISDKLTAGGTAQSGLIAFTEEFVPGQTRDLEFQLDAPAYLVEITPIKYEVIDNQNKLVTCGNAKVKEDITCGPF